MAAPSLRVGGSSCVLLPAGLGATRTTRQPTTLGRGGGRQRQPATYLTVRLFVTSTPAHERHTHLSPRPCFRKASPARALLARWPSRLQATAAAHRRHMQHAHTAQHAQGAVNECARCGAFMRCLQLLKPAGVFMSAAQEERAGEHDGQPASQPHAWRRGCAGSMACRRMMASLGWGRGWGEEGGGRGQAGLEQATTPRHAHR